MDKRGVGKCHVINVSWEEMSQLTSVKKSDEAGDIRVCVVSVENQRNPYKSCHLTSFLEVK